RGKAIVVTGAGRGLGRSYSEYAARCGAAVVVNDIDSDAAAAVEHHIVASGGRAIAASGSVAEWGQSEALIDLCVSAFGTIDGLVTNAGILQYNETPWMHTEEDVRAIVGVNVVGT